MRELLEKMISDHSGRSIEQVSHDIERDKILTAEGAVEYGLIDAVIESRKGTPALTPADSWGTPCLATEWVGTGYRSGRTLIVEEEEHRGTHR